MVVIEREQKMSHKNAGFLHPKKSKARMLDVAAPFASEHPATPGPPASHPAAFMAGAGREPGIDPDDLAPVEGHQRLEPVDGSVQVALPGEEVESKFSLPERPPVGVFQRDPLISKRPLDGRLIRGTVSVEDDLSPARQPLGSAEGVRRHPLARRWVFR